MFVADVAAAGETIAVDAVLDDEGLAVDKVAAGVVVVEAIAGAASAATTRAMSASRQDRITFSILAAWRVGS